MAWNNYLSKRPIASRESVTTIFWDPTYFDEFNFLGLHKEYLLHPQPNIEDTLRTIPRSEIDRTDSAGRTLLSWAAMRGDTATLSRLLTLGANPNRATKFGYTPLHYAAENSHYDCVKILLQEANADPDMADTKGRTPLLLASEPNIFQYLIKHGADLNKRCVYNEGSLRHAIWWGNSTDFIEGFHSASPQRPPRKVQAADDYCVLRIYLVQTNPVASQRGSLCHAAAIPRSSKIVEELAAYWQGLFDRSESLASGWTVGEVVPDMKNCSEEYLGGTLVTPDEDDPVWYEFGKTVIAAIEAKNSTTKVTVSETEVDDETSDGEAEVWQDAVEYF